MPIATPIDLATWPRRQHFEHYRSAVPCSYSMTVELDVSAFVTAVKRASRKAYIAQIWAIAAVMNRHDEFKMCLLDGGAPAVWDVIHPSFTIFNAQTETFASVSVSFDLDFAAFHDAATAIVAKHQGATGLFPQGPPPANAFDVSSLPGASFTGFTLNVANGWDHLAPIVTLGKYVVRDGKTLLPLALQVHHAAADGFHASRFVSELQQLFSEPTWTG